MAATDKPAEASGRGGARIGAGRPGSGMQRVNVMLDEATLALAREIGSGNLSAGLRLAVARYLNLVAQA